MGDNFVSSATSVALAIVGLGIIATLVGKNAQTGTVVNRIGNAFSSSITAAEGPVLGNGLSGAIGNSGYQD